MKLIYKKYTIAIEDATSDTYCSWFEQFFANFTNETFVMMPSLKDLMNKRPQQVIGISR